MNLGIVIYSNGPETVWNAFRIAVFSIKRNDDVSVFLLDKGVEAKSLDNTKFDVIVTHPSGIHAASTRSVLEKFRFVLRRNSVETKRIQ